MTPNPLTLVDTVTPSADADYAKGNNAFAGYVGGRYADLATIEHEYPNHYFVSIAVNDTERAEFADFERGDFQSVPALIAWIKDMHAEGIWRPGPYADKSTMDKILPELVRRIPRSAMRVWGASWDGHRDIPGEWDAKQYTSGPNAETGGRNVDLTVVRNEFWPIHARPVIHHIPHTTPRIWREPVRATVTFNPQTGGWEAKGA